MNILIIGSGGREHALAWKIAQSSSVNKIFITPGNPGTHHENKCKNIAIDTMDFPRLVEFAKAENIHLTIVGPEAPLAAGIVDFFTEAGLQCFGPSKAAAQIEASKAFCKDFFKKYHIPTADYAVFENNEKAKAYAKTRTFPLVIKADGLAAGKGVVIAQTLDEALTAIDEMFQHNRFGKAGQKIVIEDFLQGQEASFIVISDGKHALPLASAQDHKARDDGDQGPNTGGMGAYTPAPIITPDIEHRIMTQVIYPTLDGMQKENKPFVGFLYAGLMISPNNEIKVLEYNCRLGDPETQIIMMRLQSDLIDLCLKALHGELNKTKINWSPQHALTVVLAAQGYPDTYRKNDIIHGLNKPTSALQKLFYAGTKLQDGHVVSHGGRVLCACGLGDDLTMAKKNAYDLAKQIQFEGMFYRQDIGNKGLLDK